MSIGHLVVKCALKVLLTALWKLFIHEAPWVSKRDHWWATNRKVFHFQKKLCEETV